MTPRTRTATNAPAAKKTTARKTTAKKTTARSPRKRTATTPVLSLVKPRKPLPTRQRDFMTDVQGYATLAARIAGITTPHIRDWIDHQDGTATRALRDGTLHYNHATRTLTWQATCLMGETHAYPIRTPAAATAARVHAARCNQPHTDLTTIEPLTKKELAGLGLLQSPTWAAKDVIGEPPTTSLPAPLNAKDRALTEQTQPIPLDDIAEGLAARAADNDDTAKEHPQP